MLNKDYWFGALDGSLKTGNLDGFFARLCEATDEAIVDACIDRIEARKRAEEARSLRLFGYGIEPPAPSLVH